MSSRHGQDWLFRKTGFHLAAVLAALLVILGMASTSVYADAGHPAFYLRDENGQVIDPIAGTNADQPYSPEQTCGSCHDYDAITQGYHFQQGHDVMSDTYNADAPWQLSPGMTGKY